METYFVSGGRWLVILNGSCRYAVTGAEEEWADMLDGSKQGIVSVKK